MSRLAFSSVAQCTRLLSLDTAYIFPDPLTSLRNLSTTAYVYLRHADWLRRGRDVPANSAIFCRYYHRLRSRKMPETRLQQGPWHESTRELEWISVHIFPANKFRIISLPVIKTVRHNVYKSKVLVKLSAKPNGNMPGIQP